MGALKLEVSKAGVAAAEVLLLLLVLGLASCDWNAQESTHPLYTKNDVVSNDAIIGVWRVDAGAGFWGDPAARGLFGEPAPEWKPDGQYTIERAPGTDHYLLTPGRWASSSKPAKEQKSEVHLARIGKYLFADVESVHFKTSPPFHLFGRIFISHDAVTLRVPMMYDPEAGVLPLEHSGSSVAAVDSTEKLQKFALDHAEDRIAFIEVSLCRKGVTDCEIAVPRELFKQEPTNVDAGLQLATAYMNRGRFQEAWSTWKRTPPPKQGLRSMDTPFRVLYLASALAKWGHERNATAVLDAESRNAYPLTQWKQERNAIAAWDAQRDVLFPGSEAWCGGIAPGYLLVNQPRRVIAELKKCQGIPANKTEAEIDAALRASAYTQMGDFASARSEASRGPKDPTSTAAELVLLSDFAMGRYFTADTELKALIVASSNRKDFTGSLLAWRYFTLRHLDRESEASELLKDPRLDDDKYVSAVGESIEVKGWRRYLRGQIDEARFLANIHRREGEYVQPELCVAYFLVGEKHLLDGDRRGARRYFRNAVDQHAYLRAEWRIANARVKQLGSR